MMTHLSEQALIDLAEDAADGPAASAGRDHLAHCARCRHGVATLRETMRALGEDRMPEPSPLFWEHLSARVRAAVARDASVPPHGWWLPGWRWTLATVAGVVLVAVLVPPALERSRSGADGPVPTLATDVVLAGAGVGAGDLNWAVVDEDESWAMLIGLAEGLDVDSVSDAGIFVRPGSIEQAVLMLSEEERRDLAQAIQAELDRSAL